MDRRYQVFLSSTLEDLQDARQEVLKSLLRVNCFPAGMELFPAADEEQFEYIKKVIEQSDYYIVVSAGRYGSVHPATGKSYTEMEYDFALEIKKPVLRYLHRDPFNKLLGRQIESSEEGRSKLQAFRAKLAHMKLVNYWEQPHELGQQVILGLLDIQKTRPAVGWVKGEQAISIEIINELNELRRLVSQRAAKQPPTVKPNFAEIEGASKVPVLVASAEDQSERKFSVVSLQNSLIAEAIYRALLSTKDLSSIAMVASDLLTEDFKFSPAALKHDHVWLDLETELVETLLTLFESKGFVTYRSIGLLTEWVLTPNHRKFAAELHSLKKLGLDKGT